MRGIGSFRHAMKWALSMLEIIPWCIIWSSAVHHWTPSYISCGLPCYLPRLFSESVTELNSTVTSWSCFSSLWCWFTNVLWCVGSDAGSPRYCGVLAVVSSWNGCQLYPGCLSNSSSPSKNLFLLTSFVNYIWSFDRHCQLHQAWRACCHDLRVCLLPRLLQPSAGTYSDSIDNRIHVVNLLG